MIFSEFFKGSGLLKVSTVLSHLICLPQITALLFEQPVIQLFDSLVVLLFLGARNGQQLVAQLILRLGDQLTLESTLCIFVF